MSRFPKAAIAAFAFAGLVTAAHASGDADLGQKVFGKCKACHAVGEGAKHKVGPQLNGLIGRTAGVEDGFKYSKAMMKAGEGGLVWNEEAVAAYLADPKGYVKGNKMAFAGLKKDDDVANVIAYLATFSQSEEEGGEAQQSDAETVAPTQTAAAAAPAAEMTIPQHGVLHLGRKASEAEVAAWDVDVRPDGLGLPEGKGTVAEGEVIYADNCAVCHGDFGEAVGRWPVLAGGQDTLTNDRPVKTIGSYWPYLSTVYDYVRRAMPFGNARSLSNDEIYAITAYLLYLNDVVTDEEFELSSENFASIRLPNEANFIEDDRQSEPHYADKKEPCMSDCKPGPVEITMRARVLDVTPEGEEEEQGASAIE